MSITLKVNETTHMVGIDQPMREVLPELGVPKVLEGFDARGQPKLRAAKRAITLRHLLTHTSAYTYGNWSDLLPLLTDGYAAYDSYAKKLGLTHAQCWVHSRRGFFEAQAHDPQSVQEACNRSRRSMRLKRKFANKSSPGTASACIA
jgi:hypothetical protein